jgi:hypothetical protein
MTLGPAQKLPGASFDSDPCLKMNQKCRVNEHRALKLRLPNLFVTTCHLVRGMMDCCRWRQPQWTSAVAPHADVGAARDWAIR